MKSATLTDRVNQCGPGSSVVRNSRVSLLTPEKRYDGSLRRLMTMKQWMTTTKAATSIRLGERRSRLPMEGRFMVGALTIAFITLLTSGSIHAQGRNEALSIDQQGNVGVGTTAPQAFQVVLPESAKPTAPKPCLLYTSRCV